MDNVDQNIDIDVYLNLGDNQDPHSQELQSVPPANDLDVYGHDFSQQSQILLSNSQPSKHLRTNSGSHPTLKVKHHVAKEATAKYRERKKRYVQELEDSVRELQEQISKADEEIANFKDEIVNKLMTAAKSIQNSQNAEIFNELENIVAPGPIEEEVDIDKVNLLLDTLKYRIGPTGRERQAKLSYNFKNIINTLFPGLHRYLMATASKNLDFYKEKPNNDLAWTQQLKNRLQLTPDQQTSLKSLKGSLIENHKDVMIVITSLLSVKNRLREEGLRFDKAENEFRECMNPVQCGRWTLWCEKNKYHQDIFLQKANMHFYQDQTVEKGLRGRKRVHRSSD